MEQTSVIQHGGLDKTTFEKLFKSQYQPLCAYCCFKYGFDSATSEDIVSGGFTKLWEIRTQLDGKISLKAYVYKIIDNSSLNSIKHNKHVAAYRFESAKKMLMSQFKGGTMQDIDFQELRRHIDQAIFELPDQMRRIFELSRFEGMKYKEIADYLNISVKTVETQMGRALNKLRKQLALYYPSYIVSIILYFFHPK